MNEKSKPQGGPPEAGFLDKISDFSRTMSLSAGFLLVPVISLLVLIILVFFLSRTPGETLYYFFIGPFRNIYNFGNMLNNAVPLIIGALGITIAMKAGHLNLGGEGQVYLGAFCAAAISFSVPDSFIANYGIICVIISCAAGFLSAAVMASLSGFLKAKWNTNELITSFLFSAAIIPVVNYLVTGPFQDPASSLQSTKKISENMRLGIILKPSGLSTGIFIAFMAVVIVKFFLDKTKPGYELRMAGFNEMFARYGGVNTKFNTVIAMALSGGFLGLSGSIAVLGTYHSVIKEFSSGLGWNSLAVALIAAFNPLAVIPSALFFAWIQAGARASMQNTGLTYEVSSIMRAVIFFFSTSFLIRSLFSRRKKS